MLKWGWDTQMTELMNLTRFGCLNSLVSTLKFVLGRDVLLPLESACWLLTQVILVPVFTVLLKIK